MLRFTAHDGEVHITVKYIFNPTVHRGRQHVKNWKSVQCTEAGIVSRIESPYSAPRPASYEELKVRTLHRYRQRVKNWKPVQFTEVGIVWRIKGPYSASYGFHCQTESETNFPWPPWSYGDILQKKSWLNLYTSGVFINAHQFSVLFQVALHSLWHKFARSPCCHFFVWNYKLQRYCFLQWRQTYCVV